MIHEQENNFFILFLISSGAFGSNICIVDSKGLSHCGTPEAATPSTEYAACKKVRVGISDLDDKIVAAYEKNITEDQFIMFQLALRGLRPLTEVDDDNGRTFCSASAYTYYQSIARLIDSAIPE
jgi:hypothetical protein